MLTYAVDQVASIMHIVSDVVRQQITFNSGIYHYSNEDPCTKLEFAMTILEEAGLIGIINIVN